MAEPGEPRHPCPRCDAQGSGGADSRRESGDFSISPDSCVENPRVTPSYLQAPFLPEDPEALPDAHPLFRRQVERVVIGDVKGLVPYLPYTHVFVLIEHPRIYRIYRKCGIGLGAAREKVRVAHALEGLPKISDEFRQGRISFSKVRAMTRVATPANEDELLNIAWYGTASHVERLVSQYRKLKRLEALEAENQRHELRELNWHVDDDGSYVLKARLTPEQGERIVKAIESAMDEEF